MYYKKTTVERVDDDKGKKIETEKTEHKRREKETGVIT